MSATSIRARLAADPGVGAGNVLTTLAEMGVGLDQPCFTFDSDLDGFPAWQPLTLRQLEQLTAARDEASADPAIDRTAQVRAALPEHVAATLRHVVAVDDDDNVPLTPTGKVRKFVLRQRHLEGMSP